MRALAISVLLVLLTLSNTACIGRMAVSGRVGKFNLEVAESKWGRELVFLVMYIIPVYPTAGFIDLVIVNSIEFWTGTNPVSGQERLARVGDQKHVVAANGAEAISTLREDGSIDIEIRDVDGNTHFVNIVQEDGRVVGRDENGRNVAAVDSTTGEVRSLVDARSL